jgi:hypothetical protein
MALDLRLRYSTLGEWTNHVCTGNSIYRRSALVSVGLFDESLGYGYDNDMSYRLTSAGFRLAFRADAMSAHHWREGLTAYARQQYGFGYGRLDLVTKHRDRVAGDNVSPVGMMLHAPLMFGALALASLSLVLALAGGPARLVAQAAALLVIGLAAERAIAGALAVIRHRDAAGWFFGPAHLVRDAAWSAAIAVWTLRRAVGVASRPGDSMAPRSPRRGLSSKRTP